MSTGHFDMSIMRIGHAAGRAGLPWLLLCALLWLPGLTAVTRAADPGTVPPTPATATTATAAAAAASATATTNVDTNATATTQHRTGAARRPASASAATKPRAASPAPASADSIQLGTTDISGNRELPKLLYIVPWQRAQIGKFPGRPPNSLVDEALTPVDRPVFERQNRYYAALESSAESARSQSGIAPTPAAGGPPGDEK